MTITEELRAMVRELANDLEELVCQQYPGREQYSTQSRRYDRDMEPVRRARELLKRTEIEKK